MREIKGAVFDADGTLFDSMGLWDRMMSSCARQRT